LQTNTYTLLHVFYATIDSGWGDQTGPVLLPDGKLYGIGEYGGTKGGGAIYRLDPVSHYYEDLFDFDSTTGRNSSGGLIYLSDGKLYGMGGGGGMYNKGTIFSFDPVTMSYAVLHHFIDSTGYGPGYGTLMLGNDGKLYGVTKNGGNNYHLGTIFSYDLNNNTYNCLYKFSSAFNGAYAANPLVQTSNGKLYGVMAQAGGIGAEGVLFSYDIQSDTFTILHNFIPATGSRPESSLTLAANGKLYGTASKGGSHNAGVAFSYNIDSNLYSVIYEFDSITGLNPRGMITEAVWNTATATPDIKNNNYISVSPNPFTTTLSISLQKENLQQADFTITNIIGQPVYTKHESNLSSTYTKTLDLSYLPAGVYFLEVIAGGERSVRQLIKQ